MPKARDIVRLHPSVSANAKVLVPRHLAEQARKMHVDARVWVEAMRLANGDFRRIDVHSYDEAVVLNHPQKDEQCQVAWTRSKPPRRSSTSRR